MLSCLQTHSGIPLLDIMQPALSVSNCQCCLRTGSQTHVWTCHLRQPLGIARMAVLPGQ